MENPIIHKQPSLAKIYEYYSYVGDRIVEIAQGREAVGAYSDRRYDSRPNIIQFKADVLASVRKGITSFHISTEHWIAPMALATDNPDSYKQLRNGWDLLIDIDSMLDLGASKASVDVICRKLEKYGIKNYGIKFSGSRGFHIIVPWNAFPKEVNYRSLSRAYPAVPRILIKFIRNQIREDLMSEILKQRSIRELVDKLPEGSQLDPFYFVDVEQSWGSRHLFRAPWSLNEKTWLVSKPLSLQKVISFDMQDASIDNVLISDINSIHGLFNKQTSENEAESLLLDALDWWSMKKKKKQKTKTMKHEAPLIPVYKITEDKFPPCMKLILKGISDGRKRSVFTLATFLRASGWSPEEIEERIMEWNNLNKPPLPANYIRSQLRWHFNQKRNILPGRCFSDHFYVQIGVEKPDDICKNIKNPVSYPLRIMQQNKTAKRNYRGFSCDVCNQEFSTTRALSLHKGKVH